MRHLLVLIFALAIVSGSPSTGIAQDSPQIVRLKEQVEANPEDARSCYNLGSILSRQNRREEAVEFLTMATERDPEMTLAYYNLGIVLRELKRFDDSISALKRATDLDSSNDAAWINLAASYQGAGQFEPAAEAYQQAAQLKPGNVEAQFGVAWMLLQTGQKEAATEQYHVLSALDKARADDLYGQYQQANSGGADSGTQPPKAGLLGAIASGDLDQAGKLLQKGADPNQTDEKGNPALHLAVRAKLNEMVSLLLQAKADHNGRDRLNRTPLHVAAWENNSEAAKLLLEAGAAVDAVGFDSPSDGPSESTALILAPQAGALETAEILIKAGARVNALTNVKEGLFRRSALFWAGKENHPDVAKVLEKNGAERFPPGATQN